MSIPHQPIYNNALLFCGQNTYASVVRIIHAEDTKKGIDFSTKCLFIEESNSWGADGAPQTQTTC